MPGFDGTGPLGRGPMTGRGLGRCRGFGRRIPFRMMSKEEEVKLLKEELEEINKRLKELGEE